MSSVSDLSLLIYLTVVNNKPLPKVMSKWSGCDESIYTKDEQVELIENSISEISCFYHCPLMFYYYFKAKRLQKVMGELTSDLEVAKQPLCWMSIKIWDEEDTNRLYELKKEYIDKKELELENDNG